MILVKDITLHFGDRTLLDNVSFAVRQGENVALIGRNGAGKSTLLKMIAGLVQADSGTIDMPTSFAYLKQEISIDPSLTVVEAARSAFPQIARREPTSTRTCRANCDDSSAQHRYRCDRNA